MAAGRVADRLPPVPPCFYGPSGPDGLCGAGIPGGTHIVKVTTPDRNGVYSLKGQGQLPPSKGGCGDQGCTGGAFVTWGASPGVAVVSGCARKVSTCNVRVTPNLNGWVWVYTEELRPGTLYLLLSPSTKPEGTLAVALSTSAPGGGWTLAPRRM